jgi:nicotinamide mononucleotide transporter
MSWWEWLVFVTGVAAVGLTVKQHLLNWPIGIANSAALLVVAVQNRLYADGGLQVVYIVLGLYGWWHWLYGNPAAKNALPVTRTPVVEAAIVLMVSFVAFVGLGDLLTHLTDTDVPYYDALPTVASLAAQYLLTRKYLANWAVWIFGSNLPYVALYLYKDLPLLVALQPIYIALSIWGWIDWRRSMASTPTTVAVA